MLGKYVAPWVGTENFEEERKISFEERVKREL
jgi:hypothetical protein